MARGLCLKDVSANTQRARVCVCDILAIKKQQSLIEVKLPTTPSHPRRGDHLYDTEREDFKFTNTILFLALAGSDNYLFGK